MDIFWDTLFPAGWQDDPPSSVYRRGPFCLQPAFGGGWWASTCVPLRKGSEQVLRLSGEGPDPASALRDLSAKLKDPNRSGGDEGVLNAAKIAAWLANFRRTPHQHPELIAVGWIEVCTDVVPTYERGVVTLRLGADWKWTAQAGDMVGHPWDNPLPALSHLQGDLVFKAMDQIYCDWRVAAWCLDAARACDMEIANG